MSLYVYGIVPGGTTIPDLVGIRGEPVSVFGSEGHAALISHVDAPEEIGTPEALVAHGEVVDRVAAEAPVLPMVFGTVVPDEEALESQVLGGHHEVYDENLRRIGDAVQFTLRARFSQEDALAELVAEEPDIASLRETIAGSSEDETRTERIQLGELIVKGLQRKAAAEAPPIREALVPLAREVVEREPSQAEDVIELAALVERDHQEEFEQAAERLAREAAGRIMFRLLGPQAPYDFTGGA